MMPAAEAPTRFLRRVCTMGAGEFASKVAVTLAFIWLARVLEPAVYGQVEWALSLLAVGALVADAGLGTWATSRIGREPDAAPMLVARVGWLRLALSMGTASALLVVASAYGGGAGAALAVYAAVLLLTPFFLPYLFNGVLRSEWSGLCSAARGVGFAGAVAVLVHTGGSARRVALAEVFGAVLCALCSLFVARFVLTLRVPVRAGRHGSLALLRHSWPIGASEITWGVLWYAGLILLGYLARPEDAAWHAVGLRIVLGLHTLVWLYLYALLPTLARTVTTDAAHWKRTLEASLRTTGWVSCALALVGTLAARPLLVGVFGAAFAPAAPALRLLVWVLPVAWASGHIRYSFIASNQPRLDYHAALAGAGVTVLLTLLLAPRWRSAGAALALLGGVLANALAAAVLARRALPPVAFVASLWPSAASCLGCLMLGAILTPVAGDIRSTLTAAVALAGLAVLVERGRVPRHHLHADC